MILNDGLAESARLIALGGGGAKWSAIALGSDDGTVLPLAATNTGLGAEITAGGAGRASGAAVTVSLQATNFTDDTLRFSATWTLTAAKTIAEFMVGNTVTANTGKALLRQLFASPYDALATDVFTLDIDVISSDEAAAAQSRVTQTGIAEANKLMGSGLTPSSGRFAALAVGRDDGTILPLAEGNTALGDEILAIDALGLSRSESVARTVSVSTTNVTDDTVEVDETWNVIGATEVGEVGMFTSTAESAGVMALRLTYVDKLALMNTDVFRHILKYVSVS